MIPVGFAGASSSYSITNSVRLNGTSDYLSKTQSAGNQYTWTISTWVKRSKLTDAYMNLFHCSVGGSDNFVVRYATNGVAGDTIEIYSQTDNEFQWVSVPVFRDVSAWGHFVLAMDVTQGTAANRIKVYWNGTQVTGAAGSIFAGPYPGSTSAMKVNASGSVVQIGKNNLSRYFSGYISDFYLIDGQALTPSSFGKTDTNGVWVPIKYAGTYGTNGCKLEFKSSGALGTDTSGNGNNWTVNGSPVQTVDTPTTNSCTLNPLHSTSTWTLSGGNLIAAGSASVGNVFASIGVASGKWYWEYTCNSTGGSGRESVGVVQSTASVSSDLENSSTAWVWLNSGFKSNGGGQPTYGSGWVATNTVQVAVDMDNGKIWFGVNNTWVSSGDPAAGTNAAFTNLSGNTILPALFSQAGAGPGCNYTLNFGATAFTYTPPTGFQALCTANLPSVAVTTSGTFTGNANADGPFVWTNGNPATLTINGNAVTFGTHADKTAGGFKLRSSSASYNTSGSNTWTATAGKRFVYSATSINTAQGNP